MLDPCMKDHPVLVSTRRATCESARPASSARLPGRHLAVLVDEGDARDLVAGVRDAHLAVQRDHALLLRARLRACLPMPTMTLPSPYCTLDTITMDCTKQAK